MNRRCKKTKEKAASRKIKDAAFLWYNVIVKKQKPTRTLYSISAEITSRNRKNNRSPLKTLFE